MIIFTTLRFAISATLHPMTFQNRDMMHLSYHYFLLDYTGLIFSFWQYLAFNTVSCNSFSWFRQKSTFECYCNIVIYCCRWHCGFAKDYLISRFILIFRVQVCHKNTIKTTTRFHISVDIATKFYGVFGLYCIWSLSMNAL